MTDSDKLKVIIIYIMIMAMFMSLWWHTKANTYINTSTTCTVVVLSLWVCWPNWTSFNKTISISICL